MTSWAPTDPDEGRNRRYADGQRIYLSTCRPHQRADVLVDNSDLERPFRRAAGDG